MRCTCFTSRGALRSSPGTWMASGPSDDGSGALHFEISRGAPFLDGVSFDVQWRLVGTDGSILQSDCLTATVK